MKNSYKIKKLDWDVIVDCAAQICNSTASGIDETFLVDNLFRELKLLKVKYGRHPSILATEADYVEDAELKINLLKEAYSTACEISDFKNKAYISGYVP